MKVLHLLVAPPGETVKKIIDAMEKEHEVKVVDLSTGEISYDALVGDLFSYDRVISW